jgi:outer membrane protein
MTIMRNTRTNTLGLIAVGLVILVGIAAVPSAVVELQGGGARVGWLSTEAILRQTPGYASAESTFNAEMSSYQREVARLQAQLDSAGALFDQQQAMLSATVRQERVNELRTMQQQAETRGTELQTRAQQRRAELIAPLEDRIQRVIDGLRAERNLSMLFDVAAPGNNIVSADPTLDLTTVVIQRLNAGGQ